MNQLPELPRVLNKREAKITPKVMQWFKEMGITNYALEIKATKTGSIPKSAVMAHQLRALIQVQREEGITIKLSDAARIRQPFDVFNLSSTDAYIVACFLTQRIAIVIPPRKWEGVQIKNLDATVKIRGVFTFKI